MSRKFFLPLFLFAQILFLQGLSFFPEIVERFYSNGSYTYTSNFLRFVMGSIPFSVGDCLYLLLIFFVIKGLFFSLKGHNTNWKAKFLYLMSCLSVFYFCFHILWAFNYYRKPLFEKMHIQKEYTDADLLAFTQKMIAKTNQIQYQITKNINLPVQVPLTKNQILEAVPEGYTALSQTYSFLDYPNPSVKKSLFSWPLAYMGFSGYLNPFTNEAQVNYLCPKYTFAMTANHEMAHQLGYASESECNFIGFMACTKNKNDYIQYAGYSVALQYCLHNWQARNPKMAQLLKAKINLGVLKNYQESKKFWSQFDTPIEKGFALFYDRFLKINQQKDGLSGYSKFVDLMVNFYKNKPV